MGLISESPSGFAPYLLHMSHHTGSQSNFLSFNHLFRRDSVLSSPAFRNYASILIHKMCNDSLSKYVSIYLMSRYTLTSPSHRTRMCANPLPAITISPTCSCAEYVCTLHI